MRFIRGIFRLTTMVLMFVFFTIIILLTAWIPVRIQNTRIPSWLAMALCRSLLRLFNVQCDFHGSARLQDFAGFIFPNHVSFFDILIVNSVKPVRFLSKAEIHGWPFVGWIAIAIETVFVDRADKKSRALARDILNQTQLYPPLVLFPEGGISAPPDELKRFHYGAFEIAVQRQMPYLPCVLQYEPLQLAFWEDDDLLGQVWEVAARKEPIKVRVTLLRPIFPSVEDDPRLLAVEAHGMMETVLRYGGAEEKIIRNGL